MYVIRINISHSERLDSSGNISEKAARKAIGILFHSINWQLFKGPPALTGEIDSPMVSPQLGRIYGRKVYVALDADIDIQIIKGTRSSLLRPDKKSVVDGVYVMPPVFLKAAMMLSCVDEGDLNAVIDCAVDAWDKFDRSEMIRAERLMNSREKYPITTNTITM